MAIMRFKTAFLVVLFIVDSGRFVAASTPEIIVKDLPEYGLRLVPSTDAKFQEYLGEALKGKLDPKVEAGRPFSVLLENRSEVDLIAYSFRWIGTDSDGKTVPMGTWFFHSLGTGNESLWIHPGGVAIISPHFLVIDLKVEHQGGSSYPDPLDRMAQMATVQICLDAAIFKDGRFVGPDESQAYERALSIPRGRKAVMEEVVSRHANGQSDEALFEWLQTVADERLLSVKGALITEIEVQLHRKSAASMFLLIYQKAGSQMAFSFAAREAARPVLSITRVPYTSR